MARVLRLTLVHKQFRFLPNDAWFGRHGEDDQTQELRPLCWYSEPFNAECRAFGRLQETGREALALKCFGYVLLTEENERDITERFLGFNEATGTEVHFNGDGDDPAEDLDLRSLFPTTDGRPPPLRGILKTFGIEDRQLRPARARRLLKNIVNLQQLGIFRVDAALRQIIDGKIADFSTSITIPHFLSNPELNIHLTATDMALMEDQLFELAIMDYFQFDQMVLEWNEECEECDNPKHRVGVWAFPERHVKHKYNSRRLSSRVWTYVDLRAHARHKKLPIGRGKSARRNLPSNPPRWYCSEELSKAIFNPWGGGTWRLGWEIKEGLMFPERRKR